MVASLQWFMGDWPMNHCKSKRQETRLLSTNCDERYGDHYDDIWCLFRGWETSQGAGASPRPQLEALDPLKLPGVPLRRRAVGQKGTLGTRCLRRPDAFERHRSATGRRNAGKDHAGPCGASVAAGS